MRIDKWLWAARFFKTRALAIKACDLGRVEWNGQTAKPAREVRVGDRLRIKTEAGEYEVEVLGLSFMKGEQPHAGFPEIKYADMVRDGPKGERLQAAAAADLAGESASA